jgi:hypothetical protein
MTLNATPAPGMQADQDSGQPRGPARVRLGVITDTHLCPESTPDGRWISTQPPGRSHELLQDAITTLAGKQVDALAILGDISERQRPGACGLRDAACGRASVRYDASCCGQVTAITVTPTAS